MIVQAMKDKVDERYLMHRLRAASLAGVAGALVASGLFVYYWFADQLTRWDLLAVAIVMALVKVGTLAWYRMTD
jgi:hypothetical protein